MTKTRLIKKEIEDILNCYDLGKLNGFSYFEKGVEHTNILLNTSLGKYVLRIYERGRTKEFVKFELKLLNKLAKHRFQTPMPIKALAGKILFHFNEKPAVIFSYVKGIHIKSPNKGHISQVGNALAELHLITEGFKLEGYKVRWNANVPRIRKLADKLIKEGKKSKIKNIGLVEKVIKQEFRIFCFPEKLPKGTIHADLFKDNVKFHKGKIEGILDFDDAFYGRLIDDLNTAIFGWCFPNNKFNLQLAEQMVAAYQKVRKLNNLERKYLYQSLRFMGVKFSIYLLNRMKREKDARSFMFERLLSLQKVPGDRFDEVVLK